jgi:hypothetical protein
MPPALTIAFKDLRLFWRDRMALFWSLAFPLMFGLFFGSIFGTDGGDRAAMAVAVVDESDSEGSRAFVQRLRESAALEVDTVADAAQAQAQVRKGERVAYVRIPAGFEDGAIALFGRDPDDGAVIEIGVDPAQRVVDDLDARGQRARGVERAEVGGRERDLQEAGVGRRHLDPRQFERRAAHQRLAVLEAELRAAACLQQSQLVDAPLLERQQAVAPLALRLRHQRVRAEIQQHRPGERLATGARDARGQADRATGRGRELGAEVHGEVLADRGARLVGEAGAAQRQRQLPGVQRLAATQAGTSVDPALDRQVRRQGHELRQPVAQAGQRHAIEAGGDRPVGGGADDGELCEPPAERNAPPARIEHLVLEVVTGGRDELQRPDRTVPGAHLQARTAGPRRIEQGRRAVHLEARDAAEAAVEVDARSLQPRRRSRWFGEIDRERDVARRGARSRDAPRLDHQPVDRLRGSRCERDQDQSHGRRQRGAGAAVARRRATLIMQGPLAALWETIGHAGAPPRDSSEGFAMISVGLTALVWIVGPAVLAAFLLL